MKTYQDFLAVGEDENDIMEFCVMVKNEYIASAMYRDAVIAREYDKHRNKTIVDYQKLIYTITGRAVPDTYSANYKLASNFFHRFVVQENQYLLGNGINWNDKGTADKLGTNFNKKLSDAGHEALVAGVSYGFFDYDKLKVFKATEFAPLFDEETGALMAGVRWWQINEKKPLRMTLYTIDGIVDMEVKDGKNAILKPLHAYKTTIIGDAVDKDAGLENYEGENYPTFPIVPLWANKHHQSELTGMREQIDCYDLIKSGFADTVDEASYIYWALHDTGGMTDKDLVKFVERMKTMHAAVVQGDGAGVEPHSVEAPNESRESLLNRLSNDMYKDFMAFDTEKVTAGAVTATQIKSAYQPLASKADDYEKQIREFLSDILAIVGIEDEPIFTRSEITNVQESVNTILAAAQYLPREYVTKKIIALFGDANITDDILAEMESEDVGRYEEMGEGHSEVL